MKPPYFDYSSTMRERVQRAGLLCALVVIVAVTYRGASGNEFHFDDYDNIVEPAAVHADHLSVEALGRAATEGFLRRSASAWRWPR